MNREEREDYVIQLYKEGTTVKDIARIVHMSFRDIGTITKKLKLQADRERGYAAEDTPPKSPESRV
jgi:transposase